LIVCIDFGINTRSPWKIIHRVDEYRYGYKALSCSNDVWVRSVTIRLIDRPCTIILLNENLVSKDLITSVIRCNPVNQYIWTNNRSCGCLRDIRNLGSQNHNLSREIA
jgi:hypothetical protein